MNDHIARITERHDVAFEHGAQTAAAAHDIKHKNDLTSLYYLVLLLVPILIMERHRRRGEGRAVEPQLFVAAQVAMWSSLCAIVVTIAGGLSHNSYDENAAYTPMPGYVGGFFVVFVACYLTWLALYLTWLSKLRQARVAAAPQEEEHEEWVIPETWEEAVAEASYEWVPEERFAETKPVRHSEITDSGIVIRDRRSISPEEL